jgi:uncharacterized cupredoxin-like copper-binding protein
MSTRTRRLLLAGGATAALTAGSVAAIAAGGMPVHSNVYGLDRVVASSCAAPASLPGQRVTVMLGDMGGRGYMMGAGSMMGGRMMLRAYPQSVPAGQVSLVAVNHGSRTHELVVLPLATGASVGTRAVGSDNTVSEAGSLGESSNSCGRGSGDGIRAGATGWVTLTLTPGRYELVCNLPGHYAAGMFTELDVR